MINRRQILSRAAVAAPFVLQPMWSLFGGQASGGIVGGDYGVASGDPTPDGITLWTRVPEVFQPASGNISVSITLATTPDFTPASVVLSSRFVTGPSSDFTVRRSFTGLSSCTVYYYRFETDSGYQSVTGRTKTAPALGSLAPVRMAVVSCQNYSQGYFLSYNAIIAGDFDFILHLGDFIYEKKGSDVRTDNIGGGEATTLEHYRSKYQLYLSDPALKEARRLFPFVHLWDDHEVVNNYAGPAMTGADKARMAAGYQAFYEYNPLPGHLTQPIGVGAAPMNRVLKFGSLFDLLILDQRQFRDPVVCSRDMVVTRCAEAMAPDRTMLGTEQRDWFLGAISETEARWKFIASELMMMPVRTPKVPILNRTPVDSLDNNTFLTLDSWDGYPAEREFILNALVQNQVKDVVVCSGDIHNFFAGSVHQAPDDESSPVIAAELTTASITSKGITEWMGRFPAAAIKPGMQRKNPHIQFMDLKYHGHIEIEVTAETVSGRMVALDTIEVASGKPFVLKEFGIRRGSSKLTF